MRTQRAPERPRVVEPVLGPEAEAHWRRRDERARRSHRLLITLIGAVMVLVAMSVLVGVGNTLSPVNGWRALTHDPAAPLLAKIAIATRLPRATLAVVTGLCMGAAGALLQALTRNSLASPEITGVTEGALAAVLVWLAFGPAGAGNQQFLLPWLAVGGGLAAAGLVYGLTRRSGRVDSNRFIMIGILFGGILASLSSASLIFLGLRAGDILAWLSGSLILKSWRDVALALLYVGPGLVLLLVAIPRANALQLGDDVARSLGQRRDLDRFLVLLVTVVLTAGIVAIVGGIAFVGLIAPHMVRRSVGSDLRRLVPVSALAGAAMMLVADLLARNIDPRWLLWPLRDRIPPTELPVGIYLTLFGLPFLVMLLTRRRSRT